MFFGIQLTKDTEKTPRDLETHIEIVVKKFNMEDGKPSEVLRKTLNQSKP